MFAWLFETQTDQWAWIIGGPRFCRLAFIWFGFDSPPCCVRQTCTAAYLFLIADGSWLDLLLYQAHCYSWTMSNNVKYCSQTPHSWAMLWNVNWFHVSYCVNGCQHINKESQMFPFKQCNQGSEDKEGLLVPLAFLYFSCHWTGQGSTIENRQKLTI